MPRKLSEERTRKQMKVPQPVGGIDPQLEGAGWLLVCIHAMEDEISKE
jgi:hypothetical protein